MDIKLFFQAIIKFLAGAVFTALMIFLPAGDWKWMNGWLLIGILFIPMFLAGIVMMVKDPDLLRSRLDSKENEATQKGVILVSGLMFISSFVVAGLGVRWGWYQLPLWASITGSVVFIVSYILYAEVLRENRWLSRTVKVQEGQTVVSTGMYGTVRHPMYSVTLFLFLSMPIILGSPWSFLIMLIYPILIAKRILNEEEVLKKELAGYEEYMTRVRWRLIPFIW